MIRPMVEADLPAVAALAGELLRQHHRFDPARFFLPDDPEGGYLWWLGQKLEDADAVLLVAERGGQVVGYFYGAMEARDWVLLLDEHGAVHDIFVDAAQRRRGVASELMRAGVAALERRGARRIVLSSATANVEAQALFKKLGFRSTMVEMTRG